MEFTTYEFYTNTYYGDTIEKSSFPKWRSRAQDKLQYICMNRIDDEALAEYSREIQMATCALADLLCNIEFATNNASDPASGNVKSMSSGGQSISFGDTETLITKATSDSKVQQKLMMDAVKEYLWNTGLIFQGV